MFEALLDGRDYLFGDEFSVADCVAFPFLKFGLLWTRTTRTCSTPCSATTCARTAHPRVAAWIRRVDERPRA